MPEGRDTTAEVGPKRPGQQNRLQDDGRRSFNAHPQRHSEVDSTATPFDRDHYGSTAPCTYGLFELVGLGWA